MQFEALSLSGAMRVQLQPKSDERGFFARSFCAREFAAHDLPPGLVQCSVSFNARRGTVRGIHFQWPPSEEGKLVRCVRGSLFDVLLDLRPKSPSYLKHQTVLLDDVNRDAVYVPPGVAHGFQTLSDNTEVLYQMSDYFAADLQAGVLWNDPRFAIEWPLKDPIISERDTQCGRFVQLEYEAEYARRQGTAAPTAAPL